MSDRPSLPEATLLPRLFRPLDLRGVRLRNRVVISPMCQHAAGPGGVMADWHLVHLGKFALGGAALVFTESTAVSPQGRIGVRDIGLWADHQIEPLRRVASFVREQGAAFGVQLAHAGRKAGSAALWEGGAPLSQDELDADSRGIWERLGPSAISAGPGWTVPKALSIEEIARIVQQFVMAAERALAASVDVLELHYGHGYLVTSFLSPISNRRDDAYGGDREGRMRLAVQIAHAVRQAWPANKPLFCRLSVVDGAENGWGLEDSIVLSSRLKAVGVDVIDCSSGGLTDGTIAASVPRGPGFQVPFAARIRREAQIATQAVGMIWDARQAEAILADDSADLVAIGREALFDPYWAHHAAQTLGLDTKFSAWPPRHGAWLARRQPLIDQ